MTIAPTAPHLTIEDAGQALRSGETTSVALTQALIDVADAHDEAVGSFLARFQEQALERAAQADAELAAGVDLGPLHGIPLGVKDIITTQEGPSTAQSLILDRAWGQGDAPVAARLRAAGAVIMGKMTTMEFAIGMPDDTKPFPIPRNPWDLETWAGGSSSGSGSGVAAGMVLGALGTDTGGSIRIPAAFCGVSGLMPTFGRVPKSGCVPLGYSLDHIGPLARSARDCAAMLQALAGYDASDPGVADVAVDDYLGALTGDLTGVRIGVDRLSRIGAEHEDALLQQNVDAALAILAERGAQIVDVQLPFYEEMTAADMVVMLSEALAYHMPDLQGRWSEYFAATRGMVGSAIAFSGADYVQAQRARRVAQKALAATFADVDLIVTPTAARGATRFDEMADLVSGGKFGAIYTPYWDSTGNPVLAVPLPSGANGLPLSLQICGRPFDEALVLRAGDALQQGSDWHLRMPPMLGGAA